MREAARERIRTTDGLGFLDRRPVSSTIHYFPERAMQDDIDDIAIEVETERRLQTLIELRNRVVHGDLTAEPETAGIDMVLSAVEEAMGTAVARGEPLSIERCGVPRSHGHDRSIGP